MGAEQSAEAREAEEAEATSASAPAEADCAHGEPATQCNAAAESAPQHAHDTPVIDMMPPSTVVTEPRDEVPHLFGKGEFEPVTPLTEKWYTLKAADSSRTSTSRSITQRAYDKLTSWRPMSFRATPRHAASRRALQHNDPIQVYEGIDRVCLAVALNQVTQLKAHLMSTPNAANIRDTNSDRTPLHWAAARGHMRCLQLLLASGADADSLDSAGRTPAALALECGQLSAYQLLVYGPVKVDAKPMSGNEGPLSMVCALNQPKKLKQLLEATSFPCNPNQRDPDGDRCPLHWAAARGALNCVQLLLDAGASPGELDREGYTAAALAMELNQRGAHEMLSKASSQAILGDKGEHMAKDSSDTEEVGSRGQRLDVIQQSV